ncbi:hypothetical protein AB6A40_006435 [Gnathostoma spinigerum]|uniref:C2 domain-containing protein n=1 Tax=Gnathostoma spinigerum TaxID=75299 RepID=A0ABD6EKG4_9BILA
MLNGPILFSILCSLHPMTVALPKSDRDDGKEMFWMSAELMSVNWKQGCLTTAGCADPRFQVVKTNKANGEKIAISWPVTRDIVQDSARTFISHWMHGTPRDLSLSCQVTGLDPIYGFPRTCDATALKRIYRSSDDEVKTAISSESGRSEMMRPSENGKILVELKGKCFNATVAIQKHQLQCPWCPVHADVAVVEHQYPPEAGALDVDHRTEQQLFHIGMLVLIGVAIFLATAFTALLIAFLNLKKEAVMLNRRRRLYQDQPSHTLIRPYRVNMDESRYDAPWEQKYRPLPYCVDGGSGITISTPLDGTTVIGSTLPERISKTAIIGSQQQRTSPNISMESNHDDSGLESV